MQYTPTDCFESFPFSPSVSSLEDIGERYHSFRSEIMAARREGLTSTYNRFNSQRETSLDISSLRKLHVEMDHMVAATYGWSDIKLDHAFRETKQGVRYTLSESVRREIIERLLALNHERHAHELAVSDPAPKARIRKRVVAHPELF